MNAKCVRRRGSAGAAPAGVMAITEKRSVQNNSGLPQGPPDPSAGRLDVRQTARLRYSLAAIMTAAAERRTEGAYVHMRRREFISLLGGAAASWPVAARGQQPAMPVIGFLHTASPEPYADRVRAFRQSLSDTGYVEGRDVAIEYRWANNRADLLPALAADLVDRKVALIALSGGAVAALAAHAATKSIPIVFGIGADPVKLGLVASLNRPGGNATGVTFLTSALGAKRLGLLRELVPKATTIAYLGNPHSPTFGDQRSDIQTAARALGQQVVVVETVSERDFGAALATLLQQQAGALIVGTDPLFNSNRDQIVALAARLMIPAIYQDRESASAGGLISYGANYLDIYRQLGVYVGQVLKGAKPADLPVQQATKFEFVINLKTAKALGLDVPDKLLALADEVIE
jgi:putative tryptophan/tyrosine transport system substrate-binding protein